MIDYLALALGHGLLAIALLRLTLRADLDADPLIGEIAATTRSNRKAAPTPQHHAARSARTADPEKSEAEDPPRAATAQR
jgi:hypothetical protein